MINKNLKCYKCKLLCIVDTGYSDWTVTGTDISCLKNHFDNREQDTESEEENGILEIASEKCNDYIEGEPLELNVDCDQEEEKEKRLRECGK